MPGKTDDELGSGWSVAAAFVRLIQASILAFLLASSVTLIGSAPSVAQSSRTETRILFNIPAQPIESALDVYSAVTGREIFYDGVLASGRRSSPVRGEFVPEQALRDLLIGSGLVARATGQTSFMLAPASRASSAAYQPYFAMLQTKVSRALCGSAETRPGDIDLLLRIWVAPTGVIQRVQLQDAPDDRAGENVFAAALRGVPVGVPPSGMPQPITMAILAREVGVSMACSDTRTGFQ